MEVTGRSSNFWKLIDMEAGGSNGSWWTLVPGSSLWKFRKLVGVGGSLQGYRWKLSEAST